MSGHPLILYLAMQETSMSCMLGQLNEPDQKEKAIYYLSKKFTNCEISKFKKHKNTKKKKNINITIGQNLYKINKIEHHLNKKNKITH